ncbi:MAG TPA: Uma2 family endonuclease [Gemmataceae bacterium]|nr:Uma2 family endonuclease [Gemmataceae bacterium]
MEASTSPPDPFRFGWRDVRQIGPDASEQWVQVALTPADLLHPRRGYVTPQTSQHSRDCIYLANTLRWRLSGNPRMLVLSDCLVNWGVRGLGRPSPDISVFDNVRDPNRDRWTLHVKREKARPILVIEIVTPDAYEPQARDNDVVIKVSEYYRAGVPLYVIVDQEHEDGPRKVIGYRRGAGKYVRIRSEWQGRLLLKQVRLWLGLRDGRVGCWEENSEKEIKSLAEVYRELEAAKQARHSAEAALAEAQARLRELESRTRS